MNFDRSELVESARGAAGMAHAPYSNFAVGAALLAVSGRIYSGCNIENSSYGLTICAERVALGKAVSEGEHDFVALAVCLSGGGTPCGACRQVLHEFAPELRVVTADVDGQIVTETLLRELLPLAFGPADLEGSPGED
jgi:cytidine deaminase